MQRKFQAIDGNQLTVKAPETNAAFPLEAEQQVAGWQFSDEQRYI